MQPKCRAWIKQIQQMFPVDTIDFRSQTITYSYPYGVNTPCCKGQYELMWFTGCKDSKGREICQGDIVRAWGKNQVVSWGEGAWEPFCSDGQLDSTWHYDIIGNIWENPELVSGKEAL